MAEFMLQDTIHMIELTTSATMDTIQKVPPVVSVLTKEAGQALNPNVSEIIIIMMAIIVMVISTLTITATDTKMIHFEQIMPLLFHVHIIYLTSQEKNL